MAFQKDKDILTSTFSSLWDKMKWKASRILKDADEAEDVLQETFVRLWSKDYRIESEAQASALLGKSIRNESINRTRRKKAGPLDRDIGLEDDDGSEASRKEELLSEIALQQYEENAYTELFRKQSFDPEEIRKALNIYGALKRLVDRYALAGVSVRCFDLLDTVHSTGCLGLSILNSLGIYGGCEGDMPSLLSMAILGSITGEDLFMCNPSRFDTKNGAATFAHCTLPVTMPDRFILNTHFESGIGAAVQGSFDQGPCTLFKCAGDLSRHFTKEARILETPFSEMLCRTQVRVGIDDFSYFLTDPIGNHHILCKGHHAAETEAFFDLLKEAERD